MKPDRVTEQNARVYLYGPHRPRIHPSAFVTPGTFIVGKVTITLREQTDRGPRPRASDTALDPSREPVAPA